MTFLGVIDRFEEDFAVVRGRGFEVSLPSGLLPPAAREGSALEIKIKLLKGEERRRRKAVADLLADLQR